MNYNFDANLAPLADFPACQEKFFEDYTRSKTGDHDASQLICDEQYFSGNQTSSPFGEDLFTSQAKLILDQTSPQLYNQMTGKTAMMARHFANDDSCSETSDLDEDVSSGLDLICLEDISSANVLKTDTPVITEVGHKVNSVINHLDNISYIQAMAQLF